MTGPDEGTFDVVVGGVHDRDEQTISRDTTLAEAEADFEEHARLVPTQHRYVQVRHSGEDGAIVKTYPATG
ncbi:hypothetical protein [Mycolicibacterium vaccae]|uniref:DUF1330 domain-containing protein n=1 Tax=Mycolicibacterium vaccae ATCC 25954 TaxID=1194972 RepID=K0V4D3_MYCVA|nr:hypothetical protein [Mycolicibacterium vaccae]ANI39041.1 hypothetical protein MYVA_1850 [Mycolicibacterium vaccae 95051]EJZ12325.1 hypothetical protein MVAC_01934 [Mycolicibacterium vaccae ATCC 25954]MCV7063083.1 hypothetical protein [Mycolicibacterium vaccae]